MAIKITTQTVAAAIGDDRELAYKLKGFNGKLRVEVPPAVVDLIVEDGALVSVAAAEGDAKLAVTIPAEVLWLASTLTPPRGYESVSAAQFHGVAITGDLATAQAPYMGAVSRIYDLLRQAGGAQVQLDLPAQPPLFEDTDTAVGRYVYISVDDVRYRVFYEESGSGTEILLLQHTAGADARQWRHQLADPELQRRFRIIAYDLPYHGRSLPPTSQQWWAQDYRPSKTWLMDVVLAIADALELERPVFMGCSVGGQLALDLAAYHPQRFGAVIALNGTLTNPMAGDPFITSFNDWCRDNRISTELYGTTSLNATSPISPEPYRRELYWLYRSNFPGVYAGDNDYFLHGHNMLQNERSLDPDAVLLYALAGEFDVLAVDPEYGSPALAKHFPGVEYRELPGLGHFAPVDDPLRLRAALLPIFDQILAKITN